MNTTTREEINHPFTDAVVATLSKTFDLGVVDVAKLYELCINLERDRKILLSACLRVILCETLKGAECAASDAMRHIERGPLGLEDPDCQCSMPTRLVGDGCATCNPELARELLGDFLIIHESPSADGDETKHAALSALADRAHSILKQTP